MMEEMEIVYLLVNVMVKLLVENVQEVMISNVALEKLEKKIQHIMGHVMEVVVLVLMLIVLIVLLKLFLVNAQVEIMLDAVFQEINLHGMLTKPNIPILFAEYLAQIL